MSVKEVGASVAIWTVATQSIWLETPKTSFQSRHFKFDVSILAMENKGYILKVGRVGEFLEDSIENVCYVSGLKYSLLSASQICDKVNEVKFLPNKCIVRCLSLKRVILTTRSRKNIYVAKLQIPHGDDRTYLCPQSESSYLCHRNLGHVISSLLNKLV